MALGLIALAATSRAQGGDERPPPPAAAAPAPVPSVIRPRQAIDTSGPYWHVVFDLAAGDLDGDGKADLVVASPESGEVFLFAGPLPRIGAEDPPPSVVIAAGRGVGLSGSNSSLLVADVDGRGKKELVVGVTDAREILVFEEPLRPGRRALTRDDAATVLRSAAFGVGATVAASASVGGRETELAVAGATELSSRVFFVSGRGLAKRVELDTGASRVLPQHAKRAICENVGWDVAYADFDGDGVEEVLASSPRTPGRSGEATAGRIDVYRRADPRAPLEPSATLFGKKPRSRFGRAFAILDFDGDGRQDLATCSSHARRHLLAADGSRETRDARNVGEVYLVPNRLLRGGATSTADDPAIRVLHGGEHDERFGWTLAAGDFDGDGKDDLLVAGKFAADPSSGATARGKLYFIPNVTLADPRPWEATARSATVVTAPDGIRHFGMCGTVADFDGDGCADVAIGGMTPEASGTPIGRLFILYGGPKLFAGEPPAQRRIR